MLAGLDLGDGHRVDHSWDGELLDHPPTITHASKPLDTRQGLTSREAPAGRGTSAFAWDERRHVTTESQSVHESFTEGTFRTQCRRTADHELESSTSGRVKRTLKSTPNNRQSIPNSREKEHTQLQGRTKQRDGVQQELEPAGSPRRQIAWLNAGSMR